MNATATRTRKPEARSAKVQTIGDAVILWLTVGDNVTAYRVTALPAQFGKAAFHLMKADKGDGPGEEYDVLLDGQFSSCECKGFQRWNHCKHVESLTQLVKCGCVKAPVASAPSPVPQPEPEEEETVEITEEPPQPAACCFNCDCPYEACKCTV